jgi:hypothetical protein
MTRDRQLAKLLPCAFVLLRFALPGWCQESALAPPVRVNTRMDQATVLKGGNVPVLPHIAYDRGLLTIAADNSSLAEILDTVRIRLASTIEFPAAASSERATVRIGPARPAKVLAELLRGSPFDYLIVSSGLDPSHVRVVLSERAAHAEPQRPTIVGTPWLSVDAVPEAIESGSRTEAQSQSGDESPLGMNGASGSATAALVVSSPPVGDLPQGGQLQKTRPSKENPRVFTLVKQP